MHWWYYSFVLQNIATNKKEGDSIEKGTIKDFIRQYPEYSDKELSIDGKGRVVTGGGRVLAVPDGSGNWKINDLGGRPTADPKIRSLKVRLTEKQYSKIESAADAKGVKKADVIRNLIDEM